MVGDIDDRLFTLVADEFHLILGRQDRLGRTTVIFLARRIPDAHLHGPRKTLLCILTAILEEQGVATVTGDGQWAIKDALGPALLAAVQRIRSVVLSQLVLAAVQILDDPALDPVGHATDGGTIVRGVVFDVVVLGGKAQDDVLAAHTELLDDGAEGQESKLGLFHRRHGDCSRDGDGG